MRMRLAFVAVILPFLATASSTAQRLSLGADQQPALPPQNLVVNGDFRLGGQGWPAGAMKRQGVALKSEGGRKWLELSGYGGLSQSILIDPQWALMQVRLRMRVTGVVPGKEGWHDARLAMNFVDARGKHLDPWPEVFHAQGTSDWVSYDRGFKIPAGAVRLELAPSMFGVAGKADFADIEVTVTRLRSGVARDLPLPSGAVSLDDGSKAWRQTSDTRESVCLNGLWRFLPAEPRTAHEPPPSGHGWGWFKVPGIWPYSDGDAQQILLPDDLDSRELRGLEQAWYQRPLDVPADWASRQIVLDFTMVQTHARVWIDGHEAGEVFFPGGWLDITSRVKPGTRHVLSVLLTARPLEKESNVFMAPERVVTSKATVKCRGLTGDVWLRSQPAGEAIADVHVITSTRNGTIELDTGIDRPGAGPHMIEAQIYDHGRLVKTLRGATDISRGRTKLAGAWPDAKRWDLDAPHNLYTAIVTLRGEKGQVLDQSLPIRFGFREFWIEGRDFYLNGSRIHLRPLFTTNTTSGADQASIEGCRLTCRRLHEYGFNALITANYSFGPGEVGYLDALLAATDTEGVLATFSLPHIKDFNMKLDTPQQAERYRALCQWLIRRAENHPSVVMYAMNHNATGYKGDENPLWMDGVYSPDPEWAKTNPAKLKPRKQAALAAAIAAQIDPTRPIYHHQSGNLGDLYTVNIYLNWAPLQERSDWLQHWATSGVKPMFFVEWGLPHVSSWSSFRGPAFIWRSTALQQIWDSEFAAAYLGQSAYRMTPTKLKSMDWEEELWARGEPFSWSQLIRYFRSQDENYTQIQALFAADNWRSHRTWGISAMLPWDQENLWRASKEAGRRTPVARPYADLQRPGIVADAVAAVDPQAIYSRDASQVPPSILGQTFLRWNMPLCAYLGGDARHFTEKGHNFLAGETVHKQLIMLNDTRAAVRCSYGWSLPAAAAHGEGQVNIAPGDKAMVELAIALPETVPAGRHRLSAAFDFGPGGRQEDALAIDVMRPLDRLRSGSRIAVFDPQGQTRHMLGEIGIEARSIAAGDSLEGIELLILGRKSLEPAAGQIPGWDRLARGLKMLVFEQDAEVLEKRFGLRTNVHGLRQVFARWPSHPALKDLADGQLRDWRGSATLVPPYFEMTSVDQNDPKCNWCGFENTRVWRCGNVGSVATVLIEKPDRGDFLPIVDGGFDLQYAPLLQWKRGAGQVIFCQLDVTGRSDFDPAARKLCQNLVRWLDSAPRSASRPAEWAGDRRTGDLLRQLGIAATPVNHSPAKEGILILGPGAALENSLQSRIEAGLDVLALGLGQAEIDRLLPGTAKLKTEPTVPRMVQRFDDPLLAGISNAELHWRTRLTIAALQDRSEQSNQALGIVRLGRGRIVFCQAAPWNFDDEKKGYLRTSYRRNVFLVSRLLHNLGAADDETIETGSRYVQTPQAGDDPYRYYRW